MLPGRVVLLALLLYVTLDLSVPVVGGAFVFEVSESVDSIQAGRARPVALVVHAQSLADLGFERQPRLRLAGDRPARAVDPARDVRALHPLPRAALAPPPVSDDH